MSWELSFSTLHSFKTSEACLGNINMLANPGDDRTSKSAPNSFARFATSECLEKTMLPDLK